VKIGLICDSHMPNNERSAQWQFCKQAAECFKKEDITDIITIGDITSFGEVEAFDAYLDFFKSFTHHCVLGNSDVRDSLTAPILLNKCNGFKFLIEAKTVLGINTAYAKIQETDKVEMLKLRDGDVLVMHHPIERLIDEEDRVFLTKLCEEKALVVLYAHLHRKLSGCIGKSKLFGIRAIDPDKSFGNFPCVTYFDTDTNEVCEEIICVSKDIISDIRSYFGISCVDNHRDVEYATEKKLYGVELRCNGKGWEPDFTLIPKIEKWRKCGGKYLSVHMPNLYWQDGEIIGKDTWYKAVEYANAVGVDGLTMHPPRVKLSDFEDSEMELLELYKYAVNNVDGRVMIGVENLHMHGAETCDADRSFGYIPTEVARWRSQISTAIMNCNYVGNTLDVGHARNNGFLASKYPISRWYETIGDYIVAYHIHQVMAKPEGLKNHNAIEDWFGPQISYVSFFYNWGSGVIKKRPIFLEVKGAENFEKSIIAFDKAFM